MNKKINYGSKNKEIQKFVKMFGSRRVNKMKDTLMGDYRYMLSGSKPKKSIATQARGIGRTILRGNQTLYSKDFQTKKLGAKFEERDFTPQRRTILQKRQNKY